MLARGSFPKAGLMLEFREGPLIRQRSGRFQKGRQANEKPAAQGVGCKAADAGSSPGCYVPEWPWTSLWLSLLLKFIISYGGGGGTRQNKVSPRILLALRFPYSINGTLDYLKLFFLFGVSFYLWQQIRNSSGIKEHGMEIIWLLQLKRSTRFRNVLQACTVCMET